MCHNGDSTRRTGRSEWEGTVRVFRQRHQRRRGLRQPPATCRPGSPGAVQHQVTHFTCNCTAGRARTALAPPRVFTALNRANKSKGDPRTIGSTLDRDSSCRCFRKTTKFLTNDIAASFWATLYPNARWRIVFPTGGPPAPPPPPPAGASVGPLGAPACCAALGPAADAAGGPSWFATATPSGACFALGAACDGNARKGWLMLWEVLATSGVAVGAASCATGRAVEAGSLVACVCESAGLAAWGPVSAMVPRKWRKAGPQFRAGRSTAKFDSPWPGTSARMTIPVLSARVPWST